MENPVGPSSEYGSHMKDDSGYLLSVGLMVSRGPFLCLALEGEARGESLGQGRNRRLSKEDFLTTILDTAMTFYHAVPSLSLLSIRLCSSSSGCHY